MVRRRNSRAEDALDRDEDSETGAAPLMLTSDIKETIRNGIVEINRPLDQRSSITSQIAEIRAKLKALGINRHALNATVAYSRMEADTREAYDMSLLTAREAIGLPIQLDMWAASDQPGVAPADRAA
jgi:uncharacterized protein (UPF0335 family)